MDHGIQFDFNNLTHDRLSLIDNKIIAPESCKHGVLNISNYSNVEQAKVKSRNGISKIDNNLNFDWLAAFET